MSLLFWKKNASNDTDEVHEPARAVDEQHALPVGLYFRQQEDEEAREVTFADPLPVKMGGGINSALFITPYMLIPGITPADALDAGDAMGTGFQFVVPPKGIIISGVMLDMDDEGISTELWLFKQPFTITANDAAFAPTDSDLMNLVGVVAITTFFNVNANQVGQNAVAIPYEAPNGVLYCQALTRGTPNIAVSQDPFVQLRIEVKN